VGPSNFETACSSTEARATACEGHAGLGGEGLIGRVIEAGPHTARGPLLNSTAESVAARLVERKDRRAHGQDQRELKFQLFDPRRRLLLGQRLSRPGSTTDLYPQGIPSPDSAASIRRVGRCRVRHT